MCWSWNMIVLYLRVPLTFIICINLKAKSCGLLQVPRQLPMRKQRGRRHHVPLQPSVRRQRPGVQQPMRRFLGRRRETGRYASHSWWTDHRDHRRCERRIHPVHQRESSADLRAQAGRERSLHHQHRWGHQSGDADSGLSTCKLTYFLSDGGISCHWT